MEPVISDCGQLEPESIYHETPEFSREDPFGKQRFPNHRHKSTGALESIDRRHKVSRTYYLFEPTFF